MRLPPTATVVVTPPAAPPHAPPPSFHWIGTIPSTAYPSAETGSPDVLGVPLDEFVVAIAEARRVRIIDPHFDGRHGLGPLLEFLDNPLSKIQILSGRAKELDGWLTAGSRKLPEHIEIRDLQRASTTIHDRFALVDGDLWHFGSTVGGAHPMMSAATRGWTAEAELLETTFLAFWEKAGR